VTIAYFNACESASLPLYNFFHLSLTRTIFSLSRRVTRILHNNLLTWRERIWRFTKWLMELIVSKVMMR
jgi:hypothetical protein